MLSPTVAQKGPFGVEVEVGKSNWWCACGQSKRQPFCDGSHKGSPFVPKEYVAQASETVWFCGCKRTSGAPRCDGSHNSL